MNKIDDSYKTIGQVVKLLGLKSKKGNSLPTHTIRFWEKNFPQIKPKKFDMEIKTKNSDFWAKEIVKKFFVE